MRRSLFYMVLTITLAAFGMLSFTMVRALWYAPEVEIAVPPPDARVHEPLHEPARVRIPALNIDAKVQHVGITQKGAMGTPNNFTDVAWYKYGPSPGEEGSAVIAGHVNNGLGLSGVFEHLADITVGDDIFVERLDGVEQRFVVTSVRSYPYEEAPTNIIFNPSGSARLNLITCTGAWVKQHRTYDQRLVVFTKLADTL